MECFDPTVSFDMFMDNFFNLFVCLSTLELTFGQPVCSTKIFYTNALAMGNNSCKKKERDHIEQRCAHLAKKQCNLCGWLERHQGGLHSFFWIFSTIFSRHLLGVGTKLKESIFKNNNQINSTVTTRTWVLSTEWIRAWPSTGLVSKWKYGGGPRLFEW